MNELHHESNASLRGRLLRALRARTTHRRMARPGLVCAAAWLSVAIAACSAEDSPTPMQAGPNASQAVCVAGIDVACACTDGTQGVQTCTPQGLPGTCRCGSGLPAATAGVPAPAGMSGMAAAGTSAGAGTSGGAPDLAGAGASGTGTAGTDAAGASAGTDAPMPVANLASDIRIAEISIYQAVKVPLASAGEPVIARNAPVIVDKGALVRVSVEPLAAFTARDIVAELTLVTSAGVGTPQTVMQRVQAESSDAELGSTLNFEIEPNVIASGMRYAVALREASAGTGGTVDPDARFPRTEGELAELGPREAGPLRVMLVPYRYNGDGSGRVPSTTDETLEEYRSTLQAFYPASAIEIMLHAPVDYDGNIGPQTGWEQWLEFHCALRTMEDPDPKVLYYGVLNPAASFRDYGGGVVGISNLPSAAANYGRCSVGVGFEGAASTMAHELGHSLGLPHAPCGVSGGPFPYEEASIGVWGYGLVSKTLKDPTEFFDLMSYCSPSFISDYNYQRLFERIRYLNLQFLRVPTPPTRYERVLLARDGTLSWRGSVELDQPPGGPDEARPVVLLDEDGAGAGEISGYFFPYSLEGTGMWLVPSGAQSVQLGQHTLVMP